MLVDQVIFAATEHARTRAYRLTGQSIGVLPNDAAALQSWGPQRDALLDPHGTVTSLNCFPLPSGSHCLTQSRHDLSDLTSDGRDTYTRGIVVSTEVLAQFGHNPFALWRAFEASSAARGWQHLPGELPQLQIQGSAREFDASYVHAALLRYGVDPVLSALDAVVCHSAVATRLAGDAAGLFEAVWQLLPPQVRHELSFTTGLKFSPHRPFRVFAVSSDAAERQRVERQGDVAWVDLLDGRPASVFHGWTAWVARRLKGDQLEALANDYASLPETLRLAQLDMWAQTLLNAHGGDGTDDTPGNPSANFDRPHRAHGGFGAETGSAVLDLAEVSTDPSVVLAEHCGDAIELLETLDDLVFETVAGKPHAFVELKQQWPQLLHRVGPGLVEEVRAQYVRHAMATWQHCLDNDAIRNPHISLSVMDVIDFLLTGR